MGLSPRGLVHRAVGILSVCGLLGFTALFPAQAKHEDEEKQTEDTAPESIEPRLSVPEYQSPVVGFLSFEDADPKDWKEANDRVGELGGWLFYSREAFRSNKAQEAQEAQEADDVENEDESE